MKKRSAIALFCVAAIPCSGVALAQKLSLIRLIDTKNRVRTFQPHPHLQITAPKWTYSAPNKLELEGDIVIHDQDSKRRYKATKAQLQTDGLSIERQINAGDIFGGGAVHTALNNALQTDGITQKWRVNWTVLVGSLGCSGTSTYDRAQGVVENSHYCTEGDDRTPSQGSERYTKVTDAMIAVAVKKNPVAGSTEAGFEALVPEGATVTKFRKSQPVRTSKFERRTRR